MAALETMTIVVRALLDGDCKWRPDPANDNCWLTECSRDSWIFPTHTVEHFKFCPFCGMYRK
jgi:hypothetical protein